MSDNIIDKPLFDTMEKIEHFLNGIPQFVRLTGVERCKRLLEYLGNPQDKLKIIHVAGTNGKGSCVAPGEVHRPGGSHLRRRPGGAECHPAGHPHAGENGPPGSGAPDAGGQRSG